MRQDSLKGKGWLWAGAFICATLGILFAMSGTGDSSSEASLSVAPEVRISAPKLVASPAPKASTTTTSTTAAGEGNSSSDQAASIPHLVQVPANEPVLKYSTGSQGLTPVTTEAHHDDSSTSTTTTTLSPTSSSSDGQKSSQDGGDKSSTTTAPDMAALLFTTGTGVRKKLFGGEPGRWQKKLHVHRYR